MYMTNSRRKVQKVTIIIDAFVSCGQQHEEASLIIIVAAVCFFQV